ncbi:MAG: tetratricopeptide repeat protein [Planctomycetes bacterium]|nr:tetratricopeptide repeat protein [Planctomycetota bacterium]MCB9870537.1 tetratricopeptide repeat protein [Planctomycetota bacterium]
MTGRAQPLQPSPWFHGVWFDLILIVGTPLLVWPLVLGARQVWSAATLSQLILLTATGHYFATFVRAYGDHDLFTRFRLRFVAMPVLLVATCVWCFVSGYSGPLLLVVGMWAFWHWLAQAFGFARIYDAKAGSFSTVTAWLDKLLVISWFVGAVVLNHSATANFVNLFLDAGVPVPGAPFFAGLRWVVLVVVAGVTLAYLANLVVTLLRRQPVSWVKQFSHLSGIGFYWFAYGYMPNFFVSYVLYELFHDIQYFAITWVSCRSRVRRPGTSGWMNAMFRPGAGRVLSFLAVMLAFGVIDIGGRSLPENDPAGLVMRGLFLAAAVLHYYYDGFIWKVRDGGNRSDLGISGATTGMVDRSVRHALAWGVFFIPLLWLIGRAPDSATRDPLQRTTAILAAAPDSFEAQANYALAMVSRGEFATGLDHYRRSVALYGKSVESRFNYGSALELTGDLDAAVTQYQSALQCEDTRATHARVRTNLGVCLLARGSEQDALPHLQAVGRDAVRARIAAMAGALRPQPSRALPYQKLLVKLLPQDPGARLALAESLARTGVLDQAEIECERAVAQQPPLLPALVELGRIKLARGKRAEARALAERALGLQADDPGARKLRDDAR